MPRYRIKKVISHGRKTLYYPQVHVIFGIWKNMLTSSMYGEWKCVAKFDMLTNAQSFIESEIKKYLDGSIMAVEYIYIYIKTGEPK